MRVRACADEEVAAARQRGIRRGLLVTMDGIVDLDAVQRHVREHLFDERRGEAKDLAAPPARMRPYGHPTTRLPPPDPAVQGGPRPTIAPVPGHGERRGPIPPP